MKKYNITGMSCAACSARVEKAVKALSGVDVCTVNLLTNSMTVSGSVSEEAVIKAVEKAGYGAILAGKEIKSNEDRTDDDVKRLVKRLACSLVFLILLMYISMGHTMWGFPLPEFFTGNEAAIALSQLILAGFVMVINQRFFINGFKGVIKGAPNMDTLVALGSSAAFIYSVFELFLMTANPQTANLHNLYFESAAMILTLITVGKLLEAKAKGKTTNALKGLMSLTPKKATVIRNNEETGVSVEEVEIGDIFIVKAGEIVPVDGIITDGACSVDESALTGESIPSDKTVGDKVTGACIVKSGYIKCKATAVGEDTMLSKIIKTVSDAAASKAPIARIADRVSGVFVPFVMTVAVLTTVIWLILGQSFGYALSRGISVLVISCPCALGLATPVAIMVGSGVGAKRGILFKTATVLEETGKTDIVVLDKTGTVTCGTPSVTDIFGSSPDLLLKYAASLERKSEHPLSVAVVKEARKKGITFLPSSDFTAYTGKGVSATVDGKFVVGGKYAFVKEYCEISGELQSKADELSLQGKTPLYFALNGEPLGIIAVADEVKSDSAAAVEKLKKMGIRVIMLTGDNKLCASAVAEQTGIDEVLSNLLPEDKASEIIRLRGEGRVMMVGDGINDSPALTAADVGVAMGSGTDIAANSADVILMNNSLSDVPAAINLSKGVLTNVKENLFWAFIYNSLGIPLAAGAFVALLGWELNPMFGAAAMSLSSFCVVINALRLNFIKLDRFIPKRVKKEKRKMKKVMKIEGMMCPHCEARVKSILEELGEVETAAVSHKDGKAVLTLNKQIGDETLKSVVENAGYKVISIDTE
ncbi:MAG: cadmium-translocating P-type ATPase [Clostridia bacterium]|nr:cadmium-translocating P-type ATPase [Clostridia bacterium]